MSRFIEQWILVFVWGMTLASLLFIPRDKYRNALTVFLFKQCITWLLGLLVVEWGWISYPVRLFWKVNATSFTFEYFVYPVICVFFMLHFPERRSAWTKLAYYAAFTTGIMIPEYIIQRYTKLIDYLQWTWYWSWISLFLTFALSRLFYVWYFKPVRPDNIKP
ncbi:CBO0543 family protein [Paenibacillus elgii]|uniref:CBO0543 family protein n=1 Tax=Paenibacillus elgii TaxID=189691 RepID=UPI000248CC68|nr:CBO0543 family protein [Paenibacillus elgii]